MYEYDLFAVVNHEGQLENGHYTNFARFQNEVRPCPVVTEWSRSFSWLQWYRFDDDKYVPHGRFRGLGLTMDGHRVARSSLSACLGSTTNAYMCFYVKRHLDYKPDMKPTYRVARENDIVREQEQEKLREMARMKEVDDALMATI